jgi:group I intron endonuclease
MIIYKTTNLKNGKIYIGQTKHPDNKRYLGSGTYIKKSIKKYGRKNFLRETLEVCNTQQELNERELYWINKLNSTDKLIGYNVKIDTQGIYTDASRKAQGCKGHSTETKQKISLALKNYIRTKEHQESLYKAYQNKNLSYITEEYRNKMSKSTSGKLNGMYGKVHSKQTREKISNATQGRIPWNKGKDGSSYYTVMLCNYIDLLLLEFNINKETLFSNLQLYVQQAKSKNIIPKNKGISYNTLKKYGLIT